MTTAETKHVDVLVVGETLAWLPEGGLHKLLDPSLHRWREASADSTNPGAVG